MRMSAAVMAAWFLMLPSCALGEDDATVSNVGISPGDGGTVVQEGSILPPVDGSPKQDVSADQSASDVGSDVKVDIGSDVDADVGNEASNVDVDQSFCALNPDGTECGNGADCNDPPTCFNGQCMPNPWPDGTVCVPASGPCQQDGTCHSGSCGGPSAKPNGTVCASAPDACHTDGVCTNGSCGSSGKHADGYNWDSSDTWRRCCNGQPVRMDSNDHCGVCGIQCNTSNGESCSRNANNDQYYCTGCSSSSQCWSGCCSTSFGAPYRCAASDCVQGNCEGCPGGSCKTWSNASNSCSYD